MPRFYQDAQATDPEMRNKLAMLQAQFSGQNPESTLPMQGPAENDPALANDFKMMNDAGWFANGNGTPPEQSSQPTQLGNGTVSTLNGWGAQAAKERNQLNALLTAKVMAGDLDGASQLAVTPEDRALVQIGYAQKMNRQAGVGGDLLKNYQDAQYTNQMRQRGEQDRQLKNAQMQAMTRNVNAQATNAEIKDPTAADWSITPEGRFNKRTGQLLPLESESATSKRQRDLAAYKSGLGEVQKEESNVNNSTPLIEDLKRWKEIQPNVNTGKLSGALNWILSVNNPARQTLTTLESKLAMNNFKPGSGAMSNFERGLIVGGGPNVSNNPETNMNIANVMLGGLETAKERSEFKDQYLTKNKSLSGADKAWNDYVEANPRFTKDQSGNLTENQNRTHWTDFFSNGGTSPANKEQSPLIRPNSGSTLTPAEQKGLAILKARFEKK